MGRRVCAIWLTDKNFNLTTTRDTRQKREKKDDILGAQFKKIKK